MKTFEDWANHNGLGGELDIMTWERKAFEAGKQAGKQAGRDEVLRELSEQEPVAWRCKNSQQDGIYTQAQFTKLSFDFGCFDALIPRPAAPIADTKGEKHE